MAKMSKASKSKKSENDNYDDMEEGEGHKQTGGKHVADADEQDQMKAQKAGDQGDPFMQMMKEASRNSRYTVAMFDTQGMADPNDPINATPDEIQNTPKRKRGV